MNIYLSYKCISAAIWRSVFPIRFDLKRIFRVHKWHSNGFARLQQMKRAWFLHAQRTIVLHIPLRRRRTLVVGDFSLFVFLFYCIITQRAIMNDDEYVIRHLPSFADFVRTKIIIVKVIVCSISLLCNERVSMLHRILSNGKYNASCQETSDSNMGRARTEQTMFANCVVYKNRNKHLLSIFFLSRQ